MIRAISNEVLNGKRGEKNTHTHDKEYSSYKTKLEALEEAYSHKQVNIAKHHSAWMN